MPRYQAPLGRTKLNTVAGQRKTAGSIAVVVLRIIPARKIDQR